MQKNYKKTNMGNNISNKTLDECEEYIYNISSYEALAEITVTSNKNVNKYKVKQTCDKNKTIQEVIEPENIKGVIIKYEDNNLTVENTSLNLKKIYQDYPYVAENSMFLNDFIKKYKELEEEKSSNCKVEKKDGNIIYKIEWDNKYKKNQQLYLDENTGIPTKMIVEDDNQKVLVYILYNEIKLNIF